MTDWVPLAGWALVAALAAGLWWWVRAAWLEYRDMRDPHKHDDDN